MAVLPFDVTVTDVVATMYLISAENISWLMQPLMLNTQSSSEGTNLSQWQGSRWSFLVGFQLPAGTRVGSDQWWTGCLCQSESENFCRVKVQHWERHLHLHLSLDQLKNSYFATLVSTPVYLMTLNRPERVPRNAVSTPGSTLSTDTHRWTQKKTQMIVFLCEDIHRQKSSPGSLTGP